MPIRNKKLRRLRLGLTSIAGVFALYVVTAGLDCAIRGHIELGRIPWLRSERTFDALDAYLVPARYFIRVPGVVWLFQLSASSWEWVVGGPVCINYGTHDEQVSISDAPKDLMETFRQECPNVEVVSVAKQFGGRNHKQFIFWIIRFKEDGKLREALMDTPKKVDMTFDVQEP